MAATKRNHSKTNDACREKIQTTQLINRLQNSVLKAGEDEPKELTSNQLKAIEILLRKSLPDLSSVAHTDPDGNALTINLVRYGDSKPPE